MSSNNRSPPAKRRRIIVDRTSVGKPNTEEELSAIHSVQAKIYNFADLPQQRGKFIRTGTLRAHDHTWQIKVFPRGDKTSNKTTEHVSVFLNCMDIIGNEKIKVFFSIELGSSASSISATALDVQTLKAGSSSWGWTDFAKRDDVLSKCLDDDESLEINVDIQVCGEPRIWFPRAPAQNLLYGKRLLESSHESDVTFKVGDEQEQCHAHKIILRLQAPVLFELAQNSDSVAEIVIPNINGHVFKILKEHIYTGIFPKIDVSDASSESVKSILLGADRFGLTTLKLQMESEVISKLLKTSNATEWLLFSDGHSCPLLKEAAMETCTDNMQAIKTSSGWKNVRESRELLEELLDYATNGKPIPKSNNDYDNMSVRKLREELEFYGLDLDGTKAMLIMRLKDNDAASQSDDESSEEN